MRGSYTIQVLPLECSSLLNNISWWISHLEENLSHVKDMEIDADDTSLVTFNTDLTCLVGEEVQPSILVEC